MEQTSDTQLSVRQKNRARSKLKKSNGLVINEETGNLKEENLKAVHLTEQNLLNSEKEEWTFGLFCKALCDQLFQ